MAAPASPDKHGEGATPRTDRIVQLGVGQQWPAIVTLARQLERELAERTNALTECQATNRALVEGTSAVPSLAATPQVDIAAEWEKLFTCGRTMFESLKMLYELGYQRGSKAPSHTATMRGECHDAAERDEGCFRALEAERKLKALSATRRTILEEAADHCDKMAFEAFDHKVIHALRAAGHQLRDLASADDTTKGL